MISLAPQPQTEPDDPADRSDALLACAGPIEGTRTLIVARHGLDLMRGLIRQGCVAATCLRPGVRAEAAAHDLLILPDLTADTDLDQCLQHSRRVLSPGGRLLARITDDPTGRRARGLARRLKLQGFVGVRARASVLGAVVQAALPAVDATAHRLPSAA